MQQPRLPIHQFDDIHNFNTATSNSSNVESQDAEQSDSEQTQAPPTTFEQIGVAPFVQPEERAGRRKRDGLRGMFGSRSRRS